MQILHSEDVQILHALEVQILPAGLLNAGFSRWAEGKTRLLAWLQKLHAGCQPATRSGNVLDWRIEQTKIDCAYRCI